MNTLTEKLWTLYESKWKDFSKGLAGIVETETSDERKPTYPFLLCLNRWRNNTPNEDWYASSDLRVMVFGQETNMWGGGDAFESDSKVFNLDVPIDVIAGAYEDFYVSHYREGKFNFRNRFGTFHYGLNQLMGLLDEKFNNKRVAYIWNNLVKTGRAKGAGFPNPAIYDLERKYFDVVSKEVEILQPDIIIFLTAAYDNRIEDNFGEIHFSPIGDYDVTAVAKISGEAFEVPTFRTYHPSARIGGKEGMIERYRAIVNNINL